MITVEQLSAWACSILVCTSVGSKAEVAKDYDGIPARAKAHIALVTKVADNPSAYMAQIEQESNWKRYAKSWAGAQGYSQMMPSTGRWLSRTHCAKLGSYRPYDATWSLTCGAIYMRLLSNNYAYSNSKYCTNYWIALAKYNGGKHILRELRRSKVAGKPYSLKSARASCRRAKWACKENYEYAPRIFKKQEKYTKAGIEGISCTSAEL